jgi:hypothetical protein
MTWVGGEDFQDIVSLFSRGRDDGSEGGKGLRAFEGSERAGDFHFHFHHPQILLGQIVGEGNVEVDEEP